MSGTRPTAGSRWWSKGEPEILTSYLQAVHREFGDMIRGIREVSEPSGDESLAGFTIRY